MNDTVTGITTEIAANMPTASEAVIDAEKAKQEEAERVTSTLTDKNGSPFDSNLHEVDKNGKPLLSLRGKLRLKRGKGSTSQKSTNSSVIGGVSQVGGDKAKFIALGHTSAQTLVTCSVMIFGNDFAPVKDPNTGVDELATLTKSFGDFYEAHGVDDIPPGLSLVLAVSTYMVPRLMMENQRTKIKGWIKSIKGDADAPNDIGHDDERKKSSS